MTQANGITTNGKHKTWKDMRQTSSTISGIAEAPELVDPGRSSLYVEVDGYVL